MPQPKQAEYSVGVLLALDKLKEQFPGLLAEHPAVEVVLQAYADQISSKPETESQS
jgi:hypothetical protein